ncbi:MAG TPA: ribonuclease Y [Patescibacteria group bacterium]
MSLFNNLTQLFNTPKKGQGPGKPLPPKKVGPPVRTPQPQPLKPAKATPPSTHQVDQQALVREAQAKAREIIVEAKDEALALRTKAEQEQRELAKQLEDQQRELNRKLDRIDSRLDQIAAKEEQLERQRQDLDKVKDQIEESRQKALKQLEKVSGLTKDEARRLLLEGVEKKMSQEMAQFIRQKEEEAREVADEKVQEILVDAMKHGATDYVAEYTISTVTLPSEEVKGKIIGKSGRNIHTFEKYTGVDVDLDTSPTEVRLSCFDPVRREIARISLERLVKDGRIQPTRIEEVVNKVRSEIDKVTFEAGKKLCHEVGVYNLPNDLMKMLGKFKYRTSYGQNLIAHTLEETKIGIKLAHELKADANVVKLGCLLHDIGKVSDEAEGSHVELGVKIAKKYGMPQAVVDCIAQHHEDEPFSGPEQMVVYIADAISGARPGARYENYEEYVKRLQALEEIATKYDGVDHAYAIQAGREIRVLLDPERTKDADVTVLSTKIRDEIKEKLTYPGTVTVTVSRETRGQQVAS